MLRIANSQTITAIEWHETIIYEKSKMFEMHSNVWITGQ